MVPLPDPEPPELIVSHDESLLADQLMVAVTETLFDSPPAATVCELVLNVSEFGGGGVGPFGLPPPHETANTTNPIDNANRGNDSDMGP
jgi:hypothetical protein